MTAIANQSKTREEVQALKANWREDPCYDLYDTPGFEAHREELLNYQTYWEGVWKQDAQRRLEKKADALGVPGNTFLAAYIEKLESRIEALENRIGAQGIPS